VLVADLVIDFLELLAVFVDFVFFLLVEHLLALADGLLAEFLFIEHLALFGHGVEVLDFVVALHLVLLEVEPNIVFLAGLLFGVLLLLQLAVQFLALELLARHGVALFSRLLFEFERGIHLGDNGVYVFGLAVLRNFVHVEFRHAVDDVVLLGQLRLGRLSGGQAGLGGLLGLLLGRLLLAALHELVDHLVLDSLLKVGGYRHFRQPTVHLFLDFCTTPFETRVFL